MKEKLKIYESTIYNTRYSIIESGKLHVEAYSRSDALIMLGELADDGGGDGVLGRLGAAGIHARLALGGNRRHTLKVCRRHVSYAAKDGTWRGWNAEAWGKNPPSAYANWKY